MPLTRGRRITIRVLLVAATVLLVASIFAIWANRQVLNADNWSDTSSQLLQDDEIRGQISAFLVDEAYNNVDVQAELASGLPPQFAALAGPAAGALRSFAERVANRTLERPRVQQLWETANRATAQQFINIAEGDSKAITSSGNAVVLDLRVVLVDLAERLGLSPTLVDRIPPSAGKIKIMSSENVSLLQDSVNAVRGLSVALPAVAFAMLALAVWLSTGRRRRTLMWAGVCFVIAGVIVLFGRNIAGNAIIDALVKTDSVKPAGDNVWEISTGMLQDIAQACVVLGIPLLFAAWLAGPTSLAVGARRGMAPTLRERPGMAYGVAAFVVLLIVAWGPIHATRLVIPVLLFFGLTMLGVAALRRQTAEEFPDAVPGTTRAALRNAGEALRSRQPVAAGNTHVADLERLSSLHDRGSLSDEEFANEKSALLANGGASG